MADTDANIETEESIESSQMTTDSQYTSSQENESIENGNEFTENGNESVGNENESIQNENESVDESPSKRSKSDSSDTPPPSPSISDDNSDNDSHSTSQQESEMSHDVVKSKTKPSNKRDEGPAYSTGSSWWSARKPGSRDTEIYRAGYPGKPDYPDRNKNYLFYTNKLKARPNGMLIDDIHRDWWGEYGLLEYNHSFIQWLFPIRETGLNWDAQELQLHEVEKIRCDGEAFDRLIKSYEMMLDFYGLKMTNRQTGHVERSANWRDRFRNLNRSSHNYLRITRILKCLGEFNLEDHQVNLIRCLLHEAITERTLPNTLSSCVNYWMEVVRNDEKRRQLRDYYNKIKMNKII